MSWCVLLCCAVLAATTRGQAIHSFRSHGEAALLVLLETSRSRLWWFDVERLECVLISTSRLHRQTQASCNKQSMRPVIAIERASASAGWLHRKYLFARTALSVLKSPSSLATPKSFDENRRARCAVLAENAARVREKQCVERLALSEYRSSDRSIITTTRHMAARNIAAASTRTRTRTRTQGVLVRGMRSLPQTRKQTPPILKERARSELKFAQAQQVASLRRPPHPHHCTHPHT